MGRSIQNYPLLHQLISDTWHSKPMQDYLESEVVAKREKYGLFRDHGSVFWRYPRKRTDRIVAFLHKRAKAAQGSELAKPRAPVLVRSNEPPLCVFNGEYEREIYFLAKATHPTVFEISKPMRYGDAFQIPIFERFTGGHYGSFFEVAREALTPRTLAYVEGIAEEMPLHLREHIAAFRKPESSRSADLDISSNSNSHSSSDAEISDADHSEASAISGVKQRISEFCETLPQYSVREKGSLRELGLYVKVDNVLSALNPDWTIAKRSQWLGRVKHSAPFKSLEKHYIDVRAQKVEERAANTEKYVPSSRNLLKASAAPTFILKLIPNSQLIKC